MTTDTNIRKRLINLTAFFAVIGIMGMAVTLTDYEVNQGIERLSASNLQSQSLTRQEQQ